MFLFHCKIFCGERLFSHTSLYSTVHSQRLQDESAVVEKERKYFTKLREELQPGDGLEGGVHGADSQYKIN